MPLLVRKQILRRLIPDGTGPLVYVAHSEMSRAGLFAEACRMDLRGAWFIKYKLGAYGEGWFKCPNPNYTQKRGDVRRFSGQADESGPGPQW